MARLLILLALSGLVLASPMRAADAAERKPNLVFILLDNVGKDWFRCYGSQEDVTPNIDQLCYTGLKFRNFYVTPVCSTTRTMLLTGRYPFRTGWHTHHDSAIYGGGYLDWNRERTFARLLQEGGYATALSGKWQINDLFDPAQQDAIARHGFEEHCLWPEAPPGHPAHKQRYWDPYVIENGERIPTEGKFGPDVFTDWSIDFMERHRDEPFLLYQSAILTHIPVTTTPHHPDESASPRNKFAGMVEYADYLVGRLTGALDDLGIRDNTIVFLATDNGTDNGTDQGMPESLGGRINGAISQEGIYSLSERGINMPFIVHCPERIDRGRVSDALLNAADVLPTMIDLAGITAPDDLQLDGHSFANLLEDQPDDAFPRDWTYTQYAETRVVRDQRYKLFSTGPFYDLAADPLEQTPLSGDQMDATAAAAHQHLSGVLQSLPENAEWPWTFRSISARKRRAAADADRRADWIAEAHLPPESIRPFFRPPPKYENDYGDYRSPLDFYDGTRVKTAADWERRRIEIRQYWHQVMGPWPPLLERPVFESVEITRRDTVTQRQLRIGIGPGGKMVDAFLLVPDGDGPFPAVLVPYYDAQTGAGLGIELRDFGWQLAQRGFVTLSIGKPNSTVNLEDPRAAGHQGPYLGELERPVTSQPLSTLAYVAANAHTFLSQRPEVYPDRIGIVGHSFGGKWALMASCLYDKFDCAVWSDPGIVFDERDRRKENPGGSVNYWDVWYLGLELDRPIGDPNSYRFRRLPSEGQPRTGAYKQLVEAGHDLVELHSLMAPRPFLVSGGTADLPERWKALNHSIDVNELLGFDYRVAMTNRDTHAPTPVSNEQIYQFFQWWLQEQEPRSAAEAALTP